MPHARPLPAPEPAPSAPAAPVPAKRPYHRNRKLPGTLRYGNRKDSYNPAVALHICEEIAEGKTLKAICDRPEMPHRATFRAWCVRHPELRQAYEGARELQAHSLYDEALDIARELKGGAFTTSPAVNAAAKALEHLRWSAAKLNPAQYGEKQAPGGVMTLQINTSLNLGTAGKEYGPAPGENLYTLKATVVPTNEHAVSQAHEAETGPFAAAVIENGRPLDPPLSGDGG